MLSDLRDQIEFIKGGEEVIRGPVGQGERDRRCEGERKGWDVVRAWYNIRPGTGARGS
jgi:hypothetical protein